MDEITKYINKIIKRDFKGYKKTYVAPSFAGKEILYQRKEILSIGKIFGVTIRKSVVYFPETMLMEKHVVAYICNFYGYKEINRHQIWIATDESNRTVYWTKERLPDKSMIDSIAKLK